jgi:ureidoglycolate dehydrogenase (NAD+)
MPPADNAPVTVAAPELQGFAAALLNAAGVSQGMADEWAAALVWANLRGIDSHGVLRIPRYIELLGKGAIKSNPAMRLERKAGAIAVLDADLAPGPVAMSGAMREAIACAREVHIGWCAARNITHAGAVGRVALQAAEAGMAGIVMTASGPMMAYHGARVAGVSTNPIALAFPAADRPPFLIDMSTSAVAMGKVLDARDAKRQVPLDWGVDADGRPTSDPRRIATLLPMGGPKGSGLSFMIECLCSLTISNPIVAQALEAGGSLDSPFLNGVAIAIDLSAFGDPAAIGREAKRLGAAISALPVADNVDRIFLPGERGDSIRQERERNGIPVPAGTWSRLLAVADKLGVRPLQAASP